MMPEPRDLIMQHLDVLYERDAAGRMLRIRTSERTAVPPLAHLFRTAESNHWLLASTLSSEVHSLFNAAFAAEPVVPSLEALEATPPTRVRCAYRGPAYVFPDWLPAPAHPVEVLTDLTQLRDTLAAGPLAWIHEATPQELPIAVTRNEAGEVVSLCHSARLSRTTAEAGAETHPDYRGRGYVGAATLAWAAAIRASGRLPLYSTQWTNPASRAVAEKLGLILYGEDCHVLYAPGTAQGTPPTT